MLRWLILLLACCAAAVAGADATLAASKARGKPARDEPAFKQPSDILRFIDGYRADPRPQLLPRVVGGMVQTGVLRDPEAAGVYLGFVGGVLSSRPEDADKLLGQLFPLTPEDQIVVIKGLAYSGLPDWKERLGRLAERMPARKVTLRKFLYGDGHTLMTAPLETGPEVLDALWGFYFATGSLQPVDRIIGALALSADRNDIERLTIGSMAKYTLATNASREKELLDHCRAVAGIQPKRVATPLREVIVAAESFETARLRKEQLALIEELKRKGPLGTRKLAWWGQTAQTVLALGCVAASVAGQVQVGIPCVVGGALSSAALKALTTGAQPQ